MNVTWLHGLRFKCQPASFALAVYYSISHAQSLTQIYNKLITCCEDSITAHAREKNREEY